MLRAILILLASYYCLSECTSPDIIRLVMLNHDNYDFIESIIDTIGLYEYDNLLETIIDSVNSYTQRLDLMVDVIANLALHTDINMLILWHERMPYLAHVLKYPITRFDNSGTLVEQSLHWFLSQYKSHHLNKILRYDMTYISKPLLQHLIDLTIRDHKHLTIGIHRFVVVCISNDLNIKGLDVAKRGIYNGEKALLEFASDKYVDIHDIDITRWNDYIWLSDLGKSFANTYISKELAYSIMNTTDIKTNRPNLYNLLRSL